jgi:hypothetical protein
LRPVRELLKRGLYGLRLGENLLVIAERPPLEQAAEPGVAA